MPMRKNGLTIPDAHVNRIFSPWTCETCKKTYQEKAEIYIHYHFRDFCCSKCFRIYERAKHAQDLKQ